MRPTALVNKFYFLQVTRQTLPLNKIVIFYSYSSPLYESQLVLLCSPGIYRDPLLYDFKTILSFKIFELVQQNLMIVQT